MSRTILIVDDDQDIAALLALYLKNEGYQILLAHDGEEALVLVNREKVDLVILDVMMPKLDGLAVCREIRKTAMIPILMLSAKVEDQDKILGLLTGADDYLGKPFNPLELIARVTALLRRSNPQVSPVSKGEKIVIQSLVIDKASHLVTVNDRELKLTPSEFDILFLLASNPGRVYSSEDIFEYVWNEEGYGTSKTVMVHISNLREKIEKVTLGEKIIQTVWGVGYKIEG